MIVMIVSESGSVSGVGAGRLGARAVLGSLSS